MNECSKIKILYIITKSIWAGAGKYTHDLATNLPEHKFKVVVAAGGEGRMAQKIKNRNIQYYNIKNFQRDVSFFKDIFAFFEILSLFLKTKPDIIHVSSSKAGGIAGAASFFYSLYASLIIRRPLYKIFTVHGWVFAESRPKTQTKLIKLVSKITCLFYDRVICVSEFDQSLALKNKIAPRKKLITIHNGIKDTDYDFLSKERARGKLLGLIPKIVRPRQFGNTLLIGTIGEFTKNKGHIYLIKAIKKLVANGYPLVTIITGFGENFENLKLEIKNLKLNSTIFLIKDRPDASNFLKAFDIFVLPSMKEGLPYTILEAGMAHLPVVASRVGGIPEIIDENPPIGMGQATGLLVKPANEKELAEKIEKLINSPCLRGELSYALWEKINREFAFHKTLKATIKIYELQKAKNRGKVKNKK